jgi:hypothetical protein
MATTTTTLSEQEVRARIQRGRPLALGLGVLGLIVWASGLATNPKLALQGYHMAFFYWMGLSLGCLGFALLLHTVRGRWGLPLIRIFESGALLIAPLMAVAFLPILYDVFVAHSIFEWTHKEVVAADPVLQAKRPWLNETRFAIGALIYFAVFAFFAYRLWNGSKQEDEAGDPIKAEFLSRQRSGHAAFGIVVFMLLFTLAMVDWGQSLMPHWFSTMYAVIMIAGFGLNALALALYMVLSWRDLPLYKPIVYHEGYEGYRRDWGNFMFTLCVFWSYVSFSQLLITYSGNLYEFTQFYLRRNTGGWQYIAYIIPYLPILCALLLVPCAAHEVDSQATAGRRDDCAGDSRGGDFLADQADVVGDAEHQRVRCGGVRGAGRRLDVYDAGQPVEATACAQERAAPAGDGALRRRLYGGATEACRP